MQGTGFKDGTKYSVPCLTAQKLLKVSLTLKVPGVWGGWTSTLALTPHMARSGKHPAGEEIGEHQGEIIPFRTLMAWEKRGGWPSSVFISSPVRLLFRARLEWMLTSLRIIRRWSLYRI